MKKQKVISILGYALMISAIIYMVCKLIEDTEGDTDYIVYGMLGTIIGVFIAEYGNKKEKK